MTKMKMFAAMLLDVAVLASSALVAHAGGGGFGGGPGSNGLGDVFLIDCYHIVGGGNAPYTMDVTDQFGERQNIKVGDLQMVCVSSGPWSRQAGVSQPPLNSSFDPNTAFASTCYQANSPGDQGVGTATVVDLFGSYPGVVLKKMSMLCGPATLE